MRFYLPLLLLILMVVTSPVMAQTSAALSLDIAEKTIDITTGFNGAELVVYGTRRAEGDIAVILRGPEQDMVVRRKTRVLGLWMNGRGMAFQDVPGFYDLAVSRRPLSQLASFDELRRYHIGLDAFDFETREDDSNRVSSFREAMIRNQQAKGLFPLDARAVTFIDPDFFKVNFFLPANVPPGIYKVDAYLLHNNAVAATRSAEIKVAQSGASAEIYVFAQNHSFFYAMIAVLMALFFGWGAFVLLRRD